MEGEVYTRKQLENMENWRATFTTVIARATSFERVVCLMKNPGKIPGYFWKMPGMYSANQVNLNELQNHLDSGFLEKVNGVMPKGIIIKNKKKEAKDGQGRIKETAKRKS